MPKMAAVLQRFDDAHISDVEKAVREQLTRPEITARVNSGMRIAIGAGSRGIANIGITVRTTVQALRELGADRAFWPLDGHLSPAGHRAVADAVAPLMARLGLDAVQSSSSPR